ncbi:MAG: S8 family peptidase, partial [Anaerolineales bacterium]|nr:S8 family peptidase [Anaerolineales bacterium]
MSMESNHNINGRFIIRFSKLVIVSVMIGFMLSQAGAIRLYAQSMPRRMVDVIVVANDLPTAAAQARRFGGEHIRDLGIINAVHVRLPAHAIAALERRPGIRRVVENRPVQIGKLAMETFRDQFDTVAYSNNDGTVDWNSSWVEYDPYGGYGASGGWVYVYDGMLTFDYAWDEAVSRSFNLAGAPDATLSLDWQTYGLDNGEALSLLISKNGNTSFVELDSFGGSDSGTTSYDISDYMSSNTTIKFANVGAYWESGEYAYIDNVQIAFEDENASSQSNNIIEMDVRDKFNAVAYDNNDGLMQWAGGWIENDAAGMGLTIGNALITNGALQLDNYPLTYTGPSFARAVDLSGSVSTASLSFDYTTGSGVNHSDQISVEVSINGGATYTTIGTLEDIYGDVSRTGIYDITPYASADTMIRFRVSEGYNNYNKYFRVDNVRVAYTGVYDADYVALVDAEALHENGINGTGITVAVVDTGYWSHPEIDNNVNGNLRVLAQYNAISGQLENPTANTDDSGHGSHLNSLILNNNTEGGRSGIAPNANLVSVKAFDMNGVGSYADIISGIDWAVTNKDAYDIRVLNLSFSTTPQSYYWDDPLNQAVMRAWQAGIVVVAAAGNIGPDAMSVGVPGNVPYVITAGAQFDSFTPHDQTDDMLASFSSVGPTVEGFVKPDLVAPGAHLSGVISPDSQIALLNSDKYAGHDGYTVSGTSQATAVTSGVVALMLQYEPTLTPDDVKCRLLYNARPAQEPNGSLAYSIFQQGAG